MEEGPPVPRGDKILFRCHTSPEVKAVYLAGDFNGWAQNHSGKVTNPRFAMKSAGPGLWFLEEDLNPQDYLYVYVLEMPDGSFDWKIDTHGAGVDGKGHSILRLKPDQLEGLSWKSSGPEQGFLAGREQSSSSIQPLAVHPEKVWVQPGARHVLRISSPGGGNQDEAPLEIILTTPLGREVHRETLSWRGDSLSHTLPPLMLEGGYLATVRWGPPGNPRAAGDTVLSVVSQVADDLRYGFFSDYGQVGGDYAAKADLLARLRINAVEFYDYFPAHGHYAPTEEIYKFEPFGIQICAEDIQNKIQALHQRNILALGYVAAYAASESVYRQNPYPMTDENGTPKIYNGDIMTEAEADRQGKPKWFWLMNVADDSPWHPLILAELRRALDDDPSDRFSFDGFEIDTYGDNPDSKFYARGSRRDGHLLTDVLHDFVGDVRKVTREVKPNGLTSFNSVNEFGSRQMTDVTDFLFLEIWRFYTDQLSELVEICLRQRAPLRQRVVLKLYPADMSPSQSSWAPGTLARILGAAMTGGGTLMVSGEPSEQDQIMHGLNSLFYPSHQPLRSGNFELLEAYYRHDALLYGLTHGPQVFTTSLSIPLSGCLTRSFAAPEQHSLIVQILRVGSDRRWSANLSWPDPWQGEPIRIPRLNQMLPEKILFVSPDGTAFRNPTPIPYKTQKDFLEVPLPEFRVHATLILQYPEVDGSAEGSKE